MFCYGKDRYIENQVVSSDRLALTRLYILIRLAREWEHLEKSAFAVRMALAFKLHSDDSADRNSGELFISLI
jgi:hypothetical protein